MSEIATIKVYPAGMAPDVAEWFQPSLTLTATVSMGECDEYGCNDTVTSVRDHFNNEVYKNTGDFAQDTKEIIELYKALGREACVVDLFNTFKTLAREQ